MLPKARTLFSSLTPGTSKQGFAEKKLFGLSVRRMCSTGILQTSESDPEPIIVPNFPPTSERMRDTVRREEKKNSGREGEDKK